MRAWLVAAAALAGCAVLAVTLVAFPLERTRTVTRHEPVVLPAKASAAQIDTVLARLRAYETKRIVLSGRAYRCAAYDDSTGPRDTRFSWQLIYCRTAAPVG